MEVVPPIIADEHGDVTVFESLRDAEVYIEPIDIRNKEYEFYDASGLVLAAEVLTEPVKGGRIRQLLSPPQQHVRIVASKETNRHPTTSPRCFGTTCESWERIELRSMICGFRK